MMLSSIKRTGGEYDFLMENDEQKSVFPLLEGMSSGSGRSGLAECARCVKAFSWRIRLGPGLAHSARRLKHARHTASGGRRI